MASRRPATTLSIPLTGEYIYWRLRKGNEGVLRHSKLTLSLGAGPHASAIRVGPEEIVVTSLPYRSVVRLLPVGTHV